MVLTGAGFTIKQIFGQFQYKKRRAGLSVPVQTVSSASSSPAVPAWKEHSASASAGRKPQVTAIPHIPAAFAVSMSVAESPTIAVFSGRIPQAERISCTTEGSGFRGTLSRPPRTQPKAMPGKNLAMILSVPAWNLFDATASLTPAD